MQVIHCLFLMQNILCGVQQIQVGLVGMLGRVLLLTETVILNKLNEDGELSNSYLHVDTSYYESTGVSFKLYNKIATSTNTVMHGNGSKNYIDTLGYNLPVDAFRFLFTKNLLTDSLKIQTFSSFVEMDGYETPYNQKGKHGN